MHAFLNVLFVVEMLASVSLW